MAWWDANSPRNNRDGTSPLRLSKTRKDLALGDAFPKLDFSSLLPVNMPAAVDDLSSSAMDHDRNILSPISEEHFSPPPMAPLTVHVTIQFTDPVIRSRYSRSYTSSHTFEPTNRICNGLLRRIQLCSEELLTRKDSTALDQYKDGTYERKAMRFEITFRIIRRGYGEWAERTFRSYQKQPLTVALTKDIQLATHRIVGLFLRRYDKNFQWLDGSIVDHSPEAPETALPSSDARLSLLCVPRSRFIESSQSFEFVPGYTIKLSFRSRNPRRALPVFKRMVKVESTQPAPLSLLMSEEIQWKGLEAINRGLEEKKRDLYNHMGVCQAADCPHSDDDALQIELSISNNLGTLHHVYRDIKSNFSLFREPEARDCEDFLQSIQTSLVEARDGCDGQMNKIDDFEFNVVELRGRTWSARSPLRFSQGPSDSYGRRTIQAALDRIQTGIGDVLRGNHVAVHITARKRGHLILDKAIISREKRGRPIEIFCSVEEEKTAFIARLKARIERDMDMVFRDTCSIDDIAEDEEDIPTHLSLGPEAGYLGVRSGSIRSASPASPANSTRRSINSGFDSLPASPTKRPLQRSFSLGHRSVSSAASIVSAKNLDDFRSVDMISESSSRRSSLSVQDQPLGDRLFGDSPGSIPPSPTKPQRRFSLMPRKSSSSTRVSSASTLICETPSLLEEPLEVNALKDKSMEEEIVKAVLLGSDKVPETDGILTQDQASPVTCNEVTDSRPNDATGMALPQVLAKPARDLTSNSVSDAEVMAPEAGQSYFKLGEGDKTQEKCGSVDERLVAAGESEAADTQKPTTMDAFQDAQEYSTAGLALHAASLAAKGDGLASPGADEYSTAPSTPALSLGGDSSPRHSLLATPSSYLRGGEGDQSIFSGTKGEESEKESSPGAGFEPESTESEASTEDTDIMEAATDASGHLQSSSSENGDDINLGASIQSATEKANTAPEEEMQQEGTETSEIDNNKNGPDEYGPNSEQVESLLSDAAPMVGDAGENLQDEAVPSDTKAPAEPTASKNITCSSNETDAANTNAAVDSGNEVEHSSDDETQKFGAEEVRSGPDLVDLAPPDFPTQNVRSDPAPVSDPGHDISGANLPSDKVDDGTEESVSPVAAIVVNSDANPFVVLVDEVEAKGDEGSVPETAGSDNPVSSQPDFDPEPKDAASEATSDAPASSSIPGTRNPQDTEGDSFIKPTGSAVDAIEAELAEVAGIDDHANLTEETDKPGPAGDDETKHYASDRTLHNPAETHPVATEQEGDDIDVNDHSILKHSPAAAPDGETPAPVSVAADPDTYPDDIGHSEVAQLQARLGEDYELSESNSGTAEESGRNEKDYPQVVIGVLDQNIGTDPESTVVFQLMSDAAKQDEWQKQHQEQERVSSRRASELGEDICGHEYLTGSNRVGYAAVCLAGSEPEGVDEVEPEATVPEALAEGDQHLSGEKDTNEVANTEVSLATDAGLSSQVDEVPPVIVEVIKQILTGESPKVPEPEETGPPQVDGQSPTSSEKEVPPAASDDSIGLLHTDDTDSTPAIVTVITGDDEVSEREGPSLDEAETKLAEITENPPDIVIDLIKRVLTGESDLGAKDEGGLAGEVQDDGHVTGLLEEEGPAAVPELSEPGPALVIVADEEGPGNEAVSEPAESTEAPATVAVVLEPAGPETTSNTKPQTHELHGELPRNIPVAVPDISKQVRHFATERSMSGAGEIKSEDTDISVKDFESTVPSGPEFGPSLIVSGPELSEFLGGEGAETPRPPHGHGDGGIKIKRSAQSNFDSSSSSAFPITELERDSVGISARGSVDTIRRSFEEGESDWDETYPQTQPQTAGYLGLGDAHRRIKVGLGALGVGALNGKAEGGRGRGDIKRYSLPLQYMLDGQQEYPQDQNGAASGWKEKGKGKEKSSPRTTWSKLMGVKGEEDQTLEHRHEHHHHHHRQHKRNEKEDEESELHRHHHHLHHRGEETEKPSLLTEESSAEQAIYEGPNVVPRIMMLLAGVVAVGKIIKGPSGDY